MHNYWLKEKARNIYVEDGLSLSSIEKKLGLSINTLKDWCKEEKWMEKRQARIERTISLRERLERLLENAISNAESNMDPQAIFAIGKLVAALRTTSNIEFVDDRLKKEFEQKKKFTKEKLIELEKELGVL